MAPLESCAVTWRCDSARSHLPRNASTWNRYVRSRTSPGLPRISFSRRASSASGSPDNADRRSISATTTPSRVTRANARRRPACVEPPLADATARKTALLVRLDVPLSGDRRALVALRVLRRVLGLELRSLEAERNHDLGALRSGNRDRGDEHVL